MMSTLATFLVVYSKLKMEVKESIYTAFNSSWKVDSIRVCTRLLFFEQSAPLNNESSTVQYSTVELLGELQETTLLEVILLQN